MALTERPNTQSDRTPQTDEPRSDGPRTDGPSSDGPRTDRLPEAPHQADLPGIPHRAAPTELVGGRRAAGGRAGARLLATDARVAFLLVNHARLRAVARLFGVGPEQANLVTAIALLTLAEAAHLRFRKLIHAPGVPSRDDALLGGAVVREGLSRVAGLSSEDGPQAATLLMFAVLGGLAGPTVVRSMREAKSGAHRTSIGFHHRYGYLVDPGHWRQRHAQRASSRTSNSP